MGKIVTVDFDSTLSRKDVQEYVKGLVNKGIDVWVVTSRYDELKAPRWVNVHENYTYNQDLWGVVDRLGIPRWKVRFTCMKSKADYLTGTRVIWHLDDDEIEIEAIADQCINTKGILVTFDNWELECNRLLDD